MNNKLLSIIVPVYNVQDFIRDCIVSIVNNKIDSSLYEIIIVNDGSTDNSLDVINDLALNYQNVRIHTQTNQGLSSARNAGINLSEGDYLWFVDGDDYIDNRSLSVILDLLKNQNYEIIHFLMALGADRKFNYKSVSLCNLIPYKDYSGEECFDSGFLPSSACSSIYKRSFLDEYNLRFNNCAYREDVEFTGRAFPLSSNIYYLPNIFYYYYEREGSITKNRSIENRKKLISAEITIAESFKQFKTQYESKLVFVKDLMGERINLIIVNMMISMYKDKEIDFQFVKDIISISKEKSLYPLNVTCKTNFFKRKIIWFFVNFEMLYYLLIKLSRKK